LNSDALSGPDVGPPELQTETSAPTAYNVEEVHRLLQGFSDAELKRIPVLPEGSRLEQGATYIDLADPARREFTATSDIHVRPGEAHQSRGLGAQLAPWRRAGDGDG
jgi:hypothetical protein